jgi:hypothetical protein
MPNRIIGLSGRSGSGKDEVADHLVRRYGYRKIAIADPIREEASAFLRDALELGAWGMFDATTIPLPGHFSVVIDAFIKAIWDKPTSPEVRVFLQWFGTYRRDQDPLYWIKLLTPRITNGLIVISDVRLPLEIDKIREAGGEIWDVYRPGTPSVGIANHDTEKYLDDIVGDKTIDNVSTLEDLFRKIDAFFL